MTMEPMYPAPPVTRTDFDVDTARIPPRVDVARGPMAVVYQRTSRWSAVGRVCEAEPAAHEVLLSDTANVASDRVGLTDGRRKPVVAKERHRSQNPRLIAYACTSFREQKLCLRLRSRPSRVRNTAIVLGG